MAISITKPTVGGSEDTWGTTINTALDTIVDAVNGTSGTLAPDLSTLTINGTDVTATAAELNYMDGVTSNVQTQLNAKAPTASPTFTGTATIPTANVTTVDLGNWTVTESAGVLYFATGGSNKMQLNASGNVTATSFSGGLYVGGTGSANYLDDYEEGTWTPSLEFGNLTTGISYALTRYGTYTKVGNIVHVTGSFYLSSKGSASGSASISGLPFTSVSTTLAWTPAPVGASGVSYSGTIHARASNNTTEITLHEITDAGSFNNVTNSDFTDSAIVYFQCSYEVA